MAEFIQQHRLTQWHSPGKKGMHHQVCNYQLHHILLTGFPSFFFQACDCILICSTRTVLRRTNVKKENANKEHAVVHCVNDKKTTEDSCKKNK